MSKSKVESVDVWRTPKHLGYMTEWSVSLCTGDGDEIRCIGGDDDRDGAFAAACAAADEYGVPARILRDSGEVSRTYQPERS